MIEESLIFKKMLKGYNKTAVFALTTNCNCKCIMCNMYKKNKEYISLIDAKKILNFLIKNKFLIVYFTGGEPSLHPNLFEIINYAKRLGLITTLTTNGTIDKQMILSLKQAGLHTISVSLDHWNSKICEKIRNHKGIMEKQIRTIKTCKNIGLRVYSLSYLNPILIKDGVKKIIDYANNTLNTPLGFCYPTDCNINSYQLGGEILNYNKDDLFKSITTFYLSKKNNARIANLFTYIEDIFNFYKKEVPNFYCKGGESVFYIDWLGDIYPCFLKKKMFNILTDKIQFMQDIECDDCLINCFREPSILTQIFHSPNNMVKEILHSFPTRDIFF